MRRSVTAVGGRARRALTKIMVAKGGGLADITVGDVIAYDTERRSPAHRIDGLPHPQHGGRCDGRGCRGGGSGG
ncbi:hypothetical protein ACFWWM_25635 [Streptomyces sp. NPDC058682]|uniref:hypothetical protein n=1 Tax=unclassified Streptomyces TaxID=2593676 RepID=UPI002258C380|nr:hypothetical protein [Streptomyces sp. NBC_01214]MCX4804575.1 hypothetical protein [Streptomyces sp. NBC_01214]